MTPEDLERAGLGDLGKSGLRGDLEAPTIHPEVSKDELPCVIVHGSIPHHERMTGSGIPQSEVKEIGMSYEERFQKVLDLSRALKDHKEEIVRLAVKDLNFTVKDSVMEVDLAVDRLKMFDEARSFLQDRVPLVDPILASLSCFPITAARGSTPPLLPFTWLATR